MNKMKSKNFSMSYVSYEIKEIYDFISNSLSELELTTNDAVVCFEADYSNVYYAGETPDLTIIVRKKLKHEKSNNSKRSAG